MFSYNTIKQVTDELLKAYHQNCGTFKRFFNLLGIKPHWVKSLEAYSQVIDRCAQRTNNKSLWGRFKHWVSGLTQSAYVKKLSQCNQSRRQSVLSNDLVTSLNNHRSEINKWLTKDNSVLKVISDTIPNKQHTYTTQYENVITTLNSVNALDFDKMFMLVNEPNIVNDLYDSFNQLRDHYLLNAAHVNYLYDVSQGIDIIKSSPLRLPQVGDDLPTATDYIIDNHTLDDNTITQEKIAHNYTSKSTVHAHNIAQPTTARTTQKHNVKSIKWSQDNTQKSCPSNNTNRSTYAQIAQKVNNTPSNDWRELLNNDRIKKLQKLSTKQHKNLQKYINQLSSNNMLTSRTAKYLFDITNKKPSRPKALASKADKLLRNQSRQLFQKVKGNDALEELFVKKHDFLLTNYHQVNGLIEDINQNLKQYNRQFSELNLSNKKRQALMNGNEQNIITELQAIRKRTLQSEQTYSPNKIKIYQNEFNHNTSNLVPTPSST